MVQEREWIYGNPYIAMSILKITFEYNVDEIYVYC